MKALSWQNLIRVKRSTVSRLKQTKSKASKFVRYALVLILLGCIGSLCLAFYKYLQEPNVDPFLSLSTIGGLNYRLDITSFHPEFLEAQVEVVPVWDEMGALTNEQLTPCGVQGSPKFSFGPLQIKDRSDEFNRLGLAQVQGNVRTFSRDFTAKLKPPDRVIRQFKVLGKPYLYPFDEYLIIGSIADEVHVDCNDRKAPPFPTVSEGGFRYALHIPNMTLRSASGHDLQAWPTEVKSWSLNPDIREMIESQIKAERSLNIAGPDEYTYDLWQKNRFAIVLQRPMFVRQLAIALFVIALVSVVFVASTIPLSNWAPNIAGIFLTVWAIRSVLSSTAPNLPTLMDLGSLIIYLLGMTILILRLLTRKPVLPVNHDRANKT